MTDQKNLEVKGNFLDHPLAEILAEITQSNLNGSLAVSHAEQKIVVYFDGGEVVFAVSNSRQHRLFHILLREEKITPGQLKTIPNFANDQELKLNIYKKKILTENETQEIFSIQVREILHDALEWREGNWIFNPLVRIRNDIRVWIDLPDTLFSYGRKMPTDKIVRRFKSLQERFGARTAMPVHINLLPQEAFVFSRLDGANHSVEEVKSLSGLPEAETLKTLYTLWLGGFLIRQRWSSAFDPELLSAILSAKIELKSKAIVPKSVEPKTINEKTSSQQLKNVEVKNEISLEEYLERVEKAITYYEILDTLTDVASPEIKAAYFGLAKRFHPDLFYRRVEDNLHRRIQNAFTELAQAYETLRNKESREVYDFKLRKEIAKLAKHARAKTDGPQTSAEMIGQQAAENFEQGYDLVMDDQHNEALSCLARAVHLAGGNARYRAYYGKALSANKETYRQAEAEFQHALRIEPDNSDYRFMLADLFVKIGLVRRAEGELTRILEKSPDNREARSLLDSLLNK
ncbi:MAG: DUF4388 domain-containing protein [Pyrinomonadaceae bacterium]